MVDFRRLPDESEYEYVYRIGSMKSDIGTWQDISDILNAEMGYEYTESRYRKMFQALERMSRKAKSENPSMQLQDLMQKKLEAEKERVRARDERTEMTRAIRQQARADTLLDAIKEAIAEMVPPMPGNLPVSEMSDSPYSVIAHVTDIHGGLNTKNFANRYDESVMKERLGKYAGKLASIQNEHQIADCHLLLGGDLISGLIHSNLRLENNLNVIQQVMSVSAALCEFVDVVATYFPTVHVYAVPGNHGRCLPHKEDNVKGENLDILVFWYMKSALRTHRNVFFHENETEETVAIFEVNGNLVYGVHGDKDSVGNVVQNLSMFFHAKPDIVMMGHRHTNGLTTIYDTKVIESGCISGPDNFCMDHRLRNKPEQSVVLVSKLGVECVYNVVLD